MVINKHIPPGVKLGYGLGNGSLNNKNLIGSKVDSQIQNSYKSKKVQLLIGYPIAKAREFTPPIGL